MRKLSFFVLAGTALLANAQNKIDFAGRMAIEDVRQLQVAGGETNHSPLAAAAAASQTYSVIVEFVDDNIDYGDVDVEEISRLGNMAVVSVTPQQMEQLAALPQVQQVSLGYEKNPTMYIARPVCGVDVVQEGGDDLGRKYTGKGVVAGLFDIGLDVNHINFLNADGLPRTKGVWAYASNGKLTSYTTETQIKNFTTENSGETHGTHVLGIMGGGYAGPAKYAVIGGPNGRQAVVTAQDADDSAIPFYGVATEADLAVGCGPLSDANISAGVQKIVEYAEAHNQPCVVNLSVGSTLGPHDGTDAITRYLAQLGERAIICIAAGNDGEENVSISASKGKTIKTFVEATTSGTGTIQFWGSDDQPFTIRFIGYDRSKGKEVFSYTLDRNLEGKSVRQSDMEGFSAALKGTITMSSNVNTSNKRYNVSASVNVSGVSTTISPGFVIEPLADQTVDGYASSMVFLSNSVPGFTNGNANNSISSMACGENVIVVGSFTTAAQWAAFDTKGGATIYSYNPKPTVGAISGFSSYGKTFAGKQLPDICAPGEGIISSYSQYYVDKAPASSTQGWLMGEYTAPKGLLSRNSPWGLMQGTSMACPYVAGVIASWLEADPSLTVAAVTDIINMTAMTDAYTLTKKNRFGAGKIDALAGIKEVLNQAGTNDVVADADDVFVTNIDGRNFEVFVSGAGKVNVSLYSLSGSRVANNAAAGNTVTLSADNVTPGVYVMKIEGGNSVKTRKVVIK